MSECRVQLRRDAVNTAWGFRLQGGHEYDSPLVVQRVSRPKLSHIGLSSTPVGLEMFFPCIPMFSCCISAQ